MVKHEGKKKSLFVVLSHLFVGPFPLVDTIRRRIISLERNLRKLRHNLINLGGGSGEEDGKED